MPLPNRLALYLTAGAALLGALAPIVADLDIESVAGIAAGLAAVAAVVYKWLDGWSKWERAVPAAGVSDEPIFDEASAEPPPSVVTEAANATEELAAKTPPKPGGTTLHPKQ